MLDAQSIDKTLRWRERGGLSLNSFEGRGSYTVESLSLYSPVLTTERQVETPSGKRPATASFLLQDGYVNFASISYSAWGSVELSELLVGCGELRLSPEASNVANKTGLNERLPISLKRFTATDSTNAKMTVSYG